MLNVQFDFESFRSILREEIQTAIVLQNETELPTQYRIIELPAVLTREQLKEFLHIGDTKAAELLKRSDFPVMREAGVLVPTHLLMQWIEANTQWINLNAPKLKATS